MLPESIRLAILLTNSCILINGNRMSRTNIRYQQQLSLRLHCRIPLRWAYELESVYGQMLFLYCFTLIAFLLFHSISNIVVIIEYSFAQSCKLAGIVNTESTNVSLTQ